MTPDDAAKKLLRRFPGIRLPVRLHKICDSLGIDLRYVSAPVEAFDAFYMEGFSSPPKRLIIVNDQYSLQHQRFSVAHELGHIILNHGPTGFLHNSDPHEHEEWQEADANRFAVALLMPEEKLLYYRAIRPEQIMFLCDVSAQAAKIRAEELQRRQGSITRRSTSALRQNS